MIQSFSFKETIKKKLILAAKNYSKLINKKIVISSEYFVFKKKYIIRFYDTNFLHLTGVKTKLPPKDFFRKCLNETIDETEFDCESNKKLKGLVRLKMMNLININTFFDKELSIQEDYEKGSIRCVVAASNVTCTIGFADAKYYVRPKTLLEGNRLNKDKPIYIVEPIMQKL